MANNTPNYNLKKPEAADFYRVEDQNENMDKLDAALKGLADGTAPASHASQHGANGSDPVTPAAIGAASRDSVAALEAALADKVNIADALLNTTTDVPANDLHDRKGGVTAVYPAGSGQASSLNGPAGVGWGVNMSILTGSKAVQGLLLVDIGGNLYTAGREGDAWSPWKLQATATPPQEFSLPLAPDVTNYLSSVYWKNQFGEVTVRAFLRLKSSTFGKVLANLPVGYSPQSTMCVSATIWSGDTAASGYLAIGTDGKIALNSTVAASEANQANVVFECSFVTTP